MKYALILSAVLLSGCSTIAQIGEVEGLGEVGEVIRAVESSRVRLGGKPTSAGSAPVINRTVGEAKQLEDKTDIPSMIQSVQYIFENINAVDVPK